MKKVIYRVYVFGKDRKLLMSQKIYREDWNGFLGHLNKEVKDWRSFEFVKIILEEN